jgi:TRAP-type uncharacterized transport system substrate-binding protein
MNKLRHGLVSVRDLLATAGPFVLLCLALMALAYWSVDPNPPKTLVLATGPENSDYHVLGQRYQRKLAKHGIKVELKLTAGSQENIELLGAQANPTSVTARVDVGFVRSGARRSETDPNATPAPDAYVSLGSLFYEPVWVFYREAINLTSLTQLKGLKVNIGSQGSGAPKVVLGLLNANGVLPTDLASLQQSDYTEAVVGLLDASADVALIVSAPESLLVQMLLRTPGVKLMDFPQAEAYSRRLPNLNPVTLPRGIVDLALNSPAADVHLLAPTATLVATDSTHPALIELLVQAAHEIHGEAGWFVRAHQFPIANGSEIPVAKEAVRFYKSGPPLLQRYLPFWMANVVDRMWVVILSLGALLIPISRILPPIYEWRVRSRVYRWYGELKLIEKQLSVVNDAQARQDLAERLDLVESNVDEINVPLSYADEVYFLRGHIDQVRTKLLAIKPSV